MQLMQHIPHHLRKQTPFTPNLRKSTYKRSNPVATRNRRIVLNLITKVLCVFPQYISGHKTCTINFCVINQAAYRIILIRIS